MIDIEYRPGEIYLARIELLPDHQGHGIGTRLISALIHVARRQQHQDHHAVLPSCPGKAVKHMIHGS